MSDEGELKKRVRERWLNVPYSWVEHFEEVLDEAKQGFPKFPDVNWDRKVAEWFLKWFGGAEK